VTGIELQPGDWPVSGRQLQAVTEEYQQLREAIAGMLNQPELAEPDADLEAPLLAALARPGTYPTVWAYEQACKALHHHRERADKAEGQVDELRRGLLHIVRAVQTCSAAPAQWDAWTASGQYLYLRYRHGIGTVEPHDSTNPRTWPTDVRPLIRFESDLGEGLFIELAEFAELAGLTLADGVA
jgi:hypothetical protein